MTLEVNIHSKNGRVIEIPDGTESVSINNNERLSLEEFDALADELADLFMEFVGADVKPLSDYALSREGIYEDRL